MKKKMLVIMGMVVVLMIAATITVMAHNGIIEEQTVRNLHRCIPLFVAFASALTAKCIAILARKISDKEDKSQFSARKEVRA